VYAFFISVFVYRDLSLGDVPKVLLNSANLAAMLLYIITNAVLFSFLMAHENIPQAMGDWILAKAFGTTAFLLCVNLVLLLADNVMDPSSIILIFAPILHPAAMRLAVDSVHFDTSSTPTWKSACATRRSGSTSTSRAGYRG